MLAAGLVVLTVGCGSSAPAAAPATTVAPTTTVAATTTTTIKPEKLHKVSYAFASSETCADIAADDSVDIRAGVQVEVFDGSSNLLGYGALGDPFPFFRGGGACGFVAIFPVKTSPDGLYRATAGNSNRGFLNRSESDFVDEGDYLVLRLVDAVYNSAS